MGKKKKKLFPAYFFGTQPFNTTRTHSLPDEGVLPSIEKAALPESKRGTALSENRSWGTNVPRNSGFGEAWKYYALAGLVDPKLPAEGSAWAALLGIRYLPGVAVAAAFGVLATGTVLTLVDPYHKWDGGLDEELWYQENVDPFVHAAPKILERQSLGARLFEEMGWN